MNEVTVEHNISTLNATKYKPSIGDIVLQLPNQTKVVVINGKKLYVTPENIYYEAKSESREGQIAVALVTLNRLASGNYANDVCGVVKQKTNGMCQFSWVCQPFFTTKHLTSNTNSLYNDIRNLAVYVLMNYDNMDDVTKGATYYHADYVNPQWGLPKTTQIGRHIFYKRNTDIQTMKKEIKI
jgi:spore germination cell wall hydrolase CwlJ-like protein